MPLKNSNVNVIRLKRKEMNVSVKKSSNHSTSVSPSMLQKTPS